MSCPSFTSGFPPANEELNCKSRLTNLESQGTWINSIPKKITTRCWARVSTLHGGRSKVCTGDSLVSGIPIAVATRRT